MAKGSAGITSRIELENAIAAVADGRARMGLTLALLCGWPTKKVVAALSEIGPGRVRLSPIPPPPPPSDHVDPDVAKAMVQWFGSDEAPVCWDCMNHQVAVAGRRCRHCRRDETKRARTILNPKTEAHAKRVDRMLRDDTADATERNDRNHIDVFASNEKYQAGMDAAAFRDWESGNSGSGSQPISADHTPSAPAQLQCDADLPARGAKPSDWAAYQAEKTSGLEGGFDPASLI